MDILFIILISKLNASLILVQEYDWQNNHIRMRECIMFIEQWKPVKNYEGLYEISNMGKIRSLDRHQPHYRHKKEIRMLRGRALQCSYSKNGYLTVRLPNKTLYLHHLVWDHFGNGQRDGRSLQVDHIDNNKLNNRIDNLQLLTTRQNVGKRYKAGGKILPTGVVFRQRYLKKYEACININNKIISLGRYNNPEEAEKIYLAKIKEMDNYVKTN